MKIDALWEELEDDGLSSRGWLARVARPAAGAYPLHVAIHQETRARALLLPVKSAGLPPRSVWPECTGLDVSLVAVSGNSYICVQLRDRSSSDVFTVLAEDLVASVTTAQDDVRAVSMLFERLSRWQSFMAAARGILGLEQQRGLFGELYFLLARVIPRLGEVEAVQSWKGSAAAHQDFQLELGAIEIKTSAAKLPGSVTIASERQLDDTGVGALFLHIVHVDEREVPTAALGEGESLFTLVTRVRGHLKHVSAVLFEEKLLLAGWLEVHAERYKNRRWVVRSERSFRVNDRFPRIVEAMIPRGVGSVKYSLDLAACAAFEVTCDQLNDEILCRSSAS